MRQQRAALYRGFTLISSLKFHAFFVSLPSPSFSSPTIYRPNIWRRVQITNLSLYYSYRPYVPYCTLSSHCLNRGFSLVSTSRHDTACRRKVQEPSSTKCLLSDSATCFGLTWLSWGSCVYRNIGEITYNTASFMRE